MTRRRSFDRDTATLAAQIFEAKSDTAQATGRAIENSRAAQALDPNDRQAVYYLIVALRKSDQKDQVPALLKATLDLRTNTKANEKDSKRYRLYETRASPTAPFQ